MQFVDTHAHFLPEYYNADQIKEAYHGSLSKNVNKIINVGISHKDAADTLSVADQYSNVYAALGYHPHEASEFNDEVLDLYNSMVEENKSIVAIGEIGLDYYYEHSDKETQKHVFAKMLGFSNKLGLPVLLHVRDAFDDAFEILNASGFPWKKMVFHCFTGSKKVADYIASKGAMISLTGVITFKNFAVSAIEKFPLKQIMLETDCPYLAPIPYRGKTNVPEYIPYIAERLAQIKEMPIEKIAEVTTANAESFFNI